MLEVFLLWLPIINNEHTHPLLPVLNDILCLLSEVCLLSQCMLPNTLLHIEPFFAAPKQSAADYPLVAGMAALTLSVGRATSP